MEPALRIAGKDLRLRIRDRSFFIIGVLAPLGLAFIFKLILGGTVGEGAFTPSYAVVDLDGGQVGSSLVEVLEQVERSGSITLEAVGSRQEGERLIEEGEFDSLFVVPEGFSAAIQSGRPATLEIVGDIDAPTSTQIASAIAARFGQGVATAQLGVLTALAGRTTSPEDTAAIAGQAATIRSLTTVAPIEAASRQLDTTTYFIAGMAMFFLFFTVQFGVTGLLEERQQGTLPRLLAAPISRGSVVLGKAVTSLALGVISMAVLVVAARFLMGAKWGDPLAVGLLVLAAVLAGTGVMGVVAAVSKTPEQAGNTQSIIAVTLGMLGGSFFPVAQGGGALAALTYLTPHAWFMRGLGDLAGGGGVSRVWLPLVAMLTLAVVTGGIGWALLRRGFAR